MTILSIDYIIDVWIDDNGVDKLFTGLHIVSEVTRLINGIEVVSQVDTYLTDPYKVCITDDRYIKITDGCNSFKFDINDSPYTLQELKDLLTACYSCIDVPPDLSDVRRPLVKEGQTQATNADSITETDNVFHLGKSIDGANFTTLPANAQYNRQIQGGLKVNSKLTNLKRLVAENTPITLTVWHGFGTDGLDPSAYLNYTNFFATLTGALEVANMLFNNYITINITGTSGGNPTIVNTNPQVSGKRFQIQNGNIQLSTALSFQDCYLNFISCTITTPLGGWFNLQASDVLFQDCTLNFQYTFLFGLYNGTNLEFRGNTTINFNNDSGPQYLINIASPISGVIKLLGKSTINFNTYGQANKVVNGQIATDTAVKFIIGSKAVVNWNTLDIQGCIVDYSTGIAIGATVGADIDRTYDLNLFSSTKPVISKNFTSSNPNKTGTLKNIVVDENGVWGVNEATSGLIAKYLGSVLTAALASIDFTGDGVSVTSSGDDILVDIPGGGGLTFPQIYSMQTLEL